TANQRIRRLSPSSGGSTLTFVPHVVQPGQTVTGYVDLGSPSATPTTLQVSSSGSIPGLPTSITIPAGQTTGIVSFQAPTVTTKTATTVTATGPGVSATGTFTDGVSDNPGTRAAAQPSSLSLGSSSVPAGQS